MTDTESLVESALFRSFLRVRRKPGETVTAGVLRERWKAFAQTQGSPLAGVSHRSFGEALRDLGYSKTRRKDGWTYLDLRADSARDEINQRRARRAGKATT